MVGPGLLRRHSSAAGPLDLGCDSGGPPSRSGNAAAGLPAPDVRATVRPLPHPRTIFRMPESFDVIVIGAGPGGYVCAIRAAQLGLKVACVEKRETLGGTCLNIGCIPSKALLQSSEHYEEARRKLADHGVVIGGEVGLDLARMLARKGEVVSANVKGVEFLFRKNKVTWLKGEGRITAPGKVAVNGEEHEAKHIVIASGSESVPLAGVEGGEGGIVTPTGGVERKEG